MQFAVSIKTQTQKNFTLKSNTAVKFFTRGFNQFKYLLKLMSTFFTLRQLFHPVANFRTGRTVKQSHWSPSSYSNTVSTSKRVSEVSVTIMCFIQSTWRMCKNRDPTHRLHLPTDPHPLYTDTPPQPDTQTLCKTRSCNQSIVAGIKSISPGN